jgi:hypothetical protein
MKLPALARVAQYSGKYRPACRMSQTGVWSVAWRKQARKKVSFCSGAKLAEVIKIKSFQSGCDILADWRPQNLN